jgi:hypothetical protein
MAMAGGFSPDLVTVLRGGGIERLYSQSGGSRASVLQDENASS